MSGITNNGGVPVTSKTPIPPAPTTAKPAAAVAPAGVAAPLAPTIAGDGGTLRTDGAQALEKVLAQAAPVAPPKDQMEAEARLAIAEHAFKKAPTPETQQAF